MKTVYTTLPIYKALRDQCEERSAYNGSETAYSPVYTPKHRLPSFMWMDNGDGAATVAHIYLENGTEITTTHFTGILPALYTSLAGDDYFIYNGDTLNRSLPEGRHYLKIVMDTGHTYFSEWFQVDCVYCNFAETFAGTGFTVTNMYVSATGGGALQANSTPIRSVFLGQHISVIFNLLTTTGVVPSFSIVSASQGVISNVAASASGSNELTLTATAAADDAFIRISTSGAATFTTSEVLIYTQYACKFVTLSFTNCCNVGDILYEDSFIQTLWIHSDNIEQTYPYVEKGQENGQGKFIPTFKRQEKTCLIRTEILTQAMIDAIHRLKMHDIMTYIDQVGDAYNIESIDIEHTWEFDDKYFATAQITIELAEAVVTSGCCQ